MMIAQGRAYTIPESQAASFICRTDDKAQPGVSILAIHRVLRTQVGGFFMPPLRGRERIFSGKNFPGPVDKVLEHCYCVLSKALNGPTHGEDHVSP
jgi:hypothetical protein